MEGQSTQYGKLTFFLVILAAWAGCSISSDVPTTSGDPGVHSDDFDISDLLVLDIGDTSATISWVTTESAVSVLRVDDDSLFESTQTVTTTAAMTHGVSIDWLEPNTIYYYKVNAYATTDGDTSSERGAPFRTQDDQDLHDTTPPVIYGIEVVGVTSTSAEIHWKTDDRTRATLSYGEAAPLQEEAEEYPDSPASYSRGHSITLLGLEDETTYTFVIKATNVAQLTANSDPANFQTLKMPTISFCPDSTVIAPGDTFDLVFCIESAQDIHGLEFVVEFNSEEIVPVGGGIELELTRREFCSYDYYCELLFGRRVTSNAIMIHASWTPQYDGTTLLGTMATGDGELCSMRWRLRSGITEATLSFVTDVDRYSQASQTPDTFIDTRMVDFMNIDVGLKTRDGYVLVVTQE